VGIKKSKAADAGRIKKATPDPTLRFSFQFFDHTDEEMCPAAFDEGYTQALMQRLRDLSTWTVRRFTGSNDKSVRNHQHDWTSTARPEGFACTAIEVYPTTHVLKPGKDRISCEINARDASSTFVHAALGASLRSPEIISLAAEKDWTARICNRGPFECVEVWLENRLLVELLDAAMQKDYREGMTAANWASMFGLGR